MLAVEMTACRLDHPWRFTVNVTRSALAAIAAISLLGGCARMALYTSPNLEGPETGIRFYTPKPYLLVARTGNKDKPIDVSVVYLPDMKNPVYAKPKSGLGSANLTLGMSNGMLTNFGQQTDSKIPDLLTAFGVLNKDLATARKTAKETQLLDQSGVDYDPISRQLATIASELARDLAEARKAGILTRIELDAGDDIVRQIKSASDLLADPTKADANAPGAVTALKAALGKWEKVIRKPSAATRGPELKIRRSMETLQFQAQGELAKMVPKDPEQPTFTLYEIDNSSGSMKLYEVQF